MPDLMQVLKILCILAALITFRFVIQALMRGGKFAGVLKNIMPFVMPPLLTGGPMFIAMPVFLFFLTMDTLPPMLGLMALGGGLALTFGLLAMMTMLMQQQRQIQQLESLVAEAE